MKLELSQNQTSQYAHVGWGYLLVTAPVLILHRFAHHNFILAVAAVVVVTAGLKEYWDSHGLESKVLAGNSWEDFGFWCVGVITAAQLLWMCL